VPLRIEDIEATTWIEPGHEGLQGKWRPFPVTSPEWAPLEGDLNPLEEIAAQREQAIVNGADGPLSRECVAELRVVWNGNPVGARVCATHPAKHPFHFHCYQITPDRAWEDWRDNPHYVHAATPYWFCNNIQNAAARYSWRPFAGGTFEQLAAALQSAIRLGDQALTAAVCFQILRWGGVFHRPAFIPVRNWILARAHAGSLIADLLGATLLLSPYSAGPLAAFAPGGAYILDAGTTKIYAAAALDLSNPDAVGQDVLTYDGRVGSALGLLSRYWLQRAYPVPATFPSLLAFPWGGRTRVPRTLWFPSVQETRRNPNQRPWRFPSFHRSGTEHRANMTRLAARFIQQVIGVNGPSPTFIDAEKGLFMIGYDVREACCGCAR
jgi:hypothetical protein